MSFSRSHRRRSSKLEFPKNYNRAQNNFIIWKKIFKNKKTMEVVKLDDNYLNFNIQTLAVFGKNSLRKRIHEVSRILTLRIFFAIRNVESLLR